MIRLNRLGTPFLREARHLSGRQNRRSPPKNGSIKLPGHGRFAHRWRTVPLQRLLHEGQSSRFIAGFGDVALEDLALVVDISPQVHDLAHSTAKRVIAESVIKLGAAQELTAGTPFTLMTDVPCVAAFATVERKAETIAAGTPDVIAVVPASGGSANSERSFANTDRSSQKPDEFA
jgi:hypothetical protein